MNHCMDTKLIDIFVSYSRADSVRVESWIKRLRKGGIKVWFDAPKDNGPRRRRITAEEAARRCEVLVWFISKQCLVAREAGEVADSAATKGRKVLIVSLDGSAVPAVFDLALPKVVAIDLVQIGRQATWEAVLKEIRSQGVPYITPGSRRKRSPLPNERRSTVLAWRWLRSAIIVVALLVVASLVFTFVSHRPAPASVPQAVPSVAVSSEPKPLLTVTSEASPAKSETSPAKPVATQEEFADPRTLRAIEHVKLVIAAASRENGLTDAQINTIAGYWSDPAFIEGKGLQDASLWKASMTARQQESPKWKETVHSIKAMGTDNPTLIEVIAQTSFVAENPEHVESRGTVLAHYWVDVSVMDQPKITKMWPEQVKAF